MRVSYDEVPIKEVSDHDLLIKVKAAGLCATDYELYTNDMVYLKEKVAEITNGRMIDVVIETSAGIDVFKEIKEVIRPFGRVVLIGFFGSKKPEIDWDVYSTRDITLIGALGSPGIWDNVIELLESGRIETRSLISHRMKLEDFEKGIDIMVNRKENACKVILNP